MGRARAVVETRGWRRSRGGRAKVDDGVDVDIERGVDVDVRGRARRVRGVRAMGERCRGCGRWIERGAGVAKGG